MKRYTKEDVEKGVKEGRSFKGEDLKGLDLSGIDLSGGDFEGAFFRYSDLSNTNLTNANLSKANLRHAILKNAILINTDLREADLTHADLSGVKWVNVRYEGAIMDKIKGVNMKKFFFSQKLLDDLFEKGKATYEKDMLLVFSSRGRELFKITPAFRIIGVEEGEDSLDLLGKVKTNNELTEMGLDVYMDTAIYKDEIAYKLEPGVLGEKVEEHQLAETDKETTQILIKKGQDKEKLKEQKADDLFKELGNYVSKLIE